MLLPTWSPTEPLVHIGTMSARDKGTDSFEGHGLSVSECPDAWEAIAKLGGNAWWTLAPRGDATPVFLDWHKVDAEAHTELLKWGEAEGLCIPVASHRVSWFDTETEDWRVFTFDSASAAQSEYESLAGEYEGEPEFKPSLESVDGWMLTTTALWALSRRDADHFETLPFIGLLYAERVLGVDGVYWSDRLDVFAKSAPAAVIFPARLAHFDVAPYAADSAPAFNPRFYEESGVWHYEDNRVYGAVDFGVAADGNGRTLTISEWSCEFRDKGFSVRALEWLRPQFSAICANGVGTIDDGVPDIATMYWAHMMGKGLIDEMLDDDGAALQVSADGLISHAPTLPAATVCEASPRRMRP